MTDGATTTGYVWRPWKILSVLAACLLTAGGLVGVYLGNDAIPDRPTAMTAQTDPSPTGAPAAGSTDAPRVEVPGASGFGSGLPPVTVPDTPPDPDATPTPDPTPSAETKSETPPVDADNPWTPALLRGGLSFLVGFSLAYAVRTFMKIAIFFLGVWAASLFLLASLGWIEVHWNLIDAAFASWSSTIGEQFESARTFITGSLPSAGMAGLGLVTGFRRK